MQFLNKFGTEIELTNRFKVFKPEQITHKDNFYFVPVDGIDPTKRVSNHMVTGTTSFFLDIDIRNNLDDPEHTNDDIKNDAKVIKEKLESFDHLRDWSFIVFTGNGLQIHYIGEKIHTDPHIYSVAVNSFYEYYDETIGGYMTCDRACKNISRLRRLPGTTNQKNGAKVEILFSQDVICQYVGLIPEIGEKLLEEERIENKRQQYIKMVELQETFDKDSLELYEKINNVPIEYLVLKVMPDLKYDGKKNFKHVNGGKGFYGFFVYKNFLVNGGSRHFSDKTSYNVFDFAKRFVVRATGDEREKNRQTILYFKKMLGIQ